MAEPSSRRRRLAAEARWPGVGALVVDARVEGDVGAVQGIEGERGDDVGGDEQALRLGQGEGADRGRELGAVDEGEALLGLERHGRKAAQARGLRPRGRGVPPTTPRLRRSA